MLWFGGSFEVRCSCISRKIARERAIMNVFPSLAHKEGSGRFFFQLKLGTTQIPADERLLPLSLRYGRQKSVHSCPILDIAL